MTGSQSEQKHPEDQTTPETKSEEGSDASEEQKSIVWGNKRKLTPNKSIRYRFGEDRLTIKKVREGVISVNEEFNEDPPFLASVGPGDGYLRTGHDRGTYPVVLRFPRPVHVHPGQTFACYSTYPTTPAIHYEKEDGTSSKLVEVPGKPRKKTYYGTLTEGMLCYLHYGEIAEEPEDLPEDPRFAVVGIKLKNESSDPQKVGIVLMKPGNLDFYVRDERLCLCRLKLSIFSENHADVEYRENAPSLENAELVEPRSEQQTQTQALNLFFSVIGDHEMKAGF